MTSESLFETSNVYTTKTFFVYGTEVGSRINGITELGGNGRNRPKFREMF